MLHRLKPTVQAPYANTVRFAVIAAFTACQLLYMLGVYGITWAGVSLSLHILCPWPLPPSHIIFVCLHRTRLEFLRGFMGAHRPIARCGQFTLHPLY